MESRGERKITDSDLRQDINAGLNQSEIARKWGVSPQAINARAKRLGVGTITATIAPEESKRFTSETIDAMGQLGQSLGRVNLLMEACDEWLRDADDPSRYDISARTGDVQVTYYEILIGPDEKNVRKKNKKPLSELLQIVNQVFEVEAVEYKHADPRELILKTAQETRQTVSAAADLAEKLINLRAMEAFRATLLAEIAKVDVDVANRIAEAVRRNLVLNTALGGPQ